MARCAPGLAETTVSTQARERRPGRVNQVTRVRIYSEAFTVISPPAERRGDRVGNRSDLLKQEARRRRTLFARFGERRQSKEAGDE